MASARPAMPAQIMAMVKDGSGVDDIDMDMDIGGAD